jgi:uncharacterized membrane protein
MFTPALALGLGFNFLESWVLSCAGATFSSFCFYWTAEYFMVKAHKKKVKKYLEAEKKGTPLKSKKQFTRTNKLILWIKNKVGWYGTSFFIPLFLSIPVGSIIVAKFYGKRSFSFPLIIIGIIINGFIITSISYFVIK